MDQICQALQLSKGAIYVYLEYKEELFISALQAIYERRFAILSTATRQTIRSPLNLRKFWMVSEA